MYVSGDCTWQDDVGRHNTVNREIFVVKIFLESMASPNIKHAKFTHIINDNAVRSRLSENYST